MHVLEMFLVPKSSASSGGALKIKSLKDLFFFQESFSSCRDLFYESASFALFRLGGD